MGGDDKGELTPFFFVSSLREAIAIFSKLINVTWISIYYIVTKISYPVKTPFLSFTCEDITVVMATSVSANEIY